MISASTIHSRALAKLDADGSDRYTFNEVTKHAINGAIEDLITMLNQAFSENKLSPENLRELMKTKVWVANSYSRVAFNSSEVGHEMWTLLAVFPACQTNKQSNVAQSQATQSTFRPDVSFTGGAKPARRLTHEEWVENEDNIFTAGNNVLTGKMAEYAYLDMSDYTSTTYTNTDAHEITIRPDASGKFVALSYLKYPNQVSGINDLIEFPKSLTELITEMVVNKISYKEGDAPLIQITAASINRLVGFLK
jgi:hypothetical protein